MEPPKGAPPPDLLDGHLKPSSNMSSGDPLDLSALEQSLMDLSIKIKKEPTLEGSRRDVHGTGLVYSNSMAEPRCLWDDKYEENPRRYTSIVSRINELGLVERCTRIEPRAATEEEVLRVHSKEHFDKVQATANLDDVEKLERISSEYDAVYFHPSTFEQSMLAAGSTIAAIDAIMKDQVQNAFALVRPPGHHAMRDEACGYCFFNNVAIAAKHALENLAVNRILIVDWDVHHGQATQYTFDDDPRVMYLSIHRYEHGAFWPELIESNYNWTGAEGAKGFTINVPLNETGIHDRDYLAIFHNIILPVGYRFNPDLVIVSAGYDAAIGCPEGEMRVSPAAYAHFTRSLGALANGRLLVALEGGYCIKSLAEGAALTLRSLLGDPTPDIVTLQREPRLHKSLVESVLDVAWAHRKYWPEAFPLQGTFDRHTADEQERPPDNPLPADALRARHYPVVEYRGKVALQPKPTSYPTRDCYPIQAPELKAALDQEINGLIETTKLNSSFIGKKSTGLVYDEKMCIHKAADRSHPERPTRIKAIFKKLTAQGLVQRCELVQSREVSREELYLVHSKDHVMKMYHLADLTPKELRDLADSYDSIYLHKETNEAAKLSAGSLLELVDNVLRGDLLNGFAIIRPPGHHASQDLASGFCIYNNVALAAKYALKNYEDVKKVLIFDYDVHHGDGTQRLVAGDDRIMYISTHRYEYAEFFPTNIISSLKTGSKNVINIPFNNDQMGDSEYLAAVLAIVLPIAYDFSPDLVLISSGFDACINDPLGHYAISPPLYGHIIRQLSTLAGGKMVAALEGGYNLDSISDAACHVVSALLGDNLESIGLNSLSGSAIETLKEVVDYHATNWPSMQFGVDLPQNLS